ncbi:MAG: ERF family protein [Hyphomicrobium sp.]|jgi:hypothetical protein
MNNSEIIEIQQHTPAVQQAATPALLLQMAVQQGADLDKLERLMALQERWEETEARKAYDTAFAAFKSEAVKIVKNKQVSAGPLSGKSYAELFSVVNAVTPALSAHGLSSSWKISRDEKDWLEVTCTIKHSAGHMESVSMGGPPDVGGAKNPIQARASTVSYLQRYTLKAITGLSEQDDDTDGAHKDEVPAELLQEARDSAMGGWKALSLWIAKRTEAERAALNPESANLKAAAKAADKAAEK